MRPEFEQQVEIPSQSTRGKKPYVPSEAKETRKCPESFLRLNSATQQDEKPTQMLRWPHFPLTTMHGYLCTRHARQRSSECIQCDTRAVQTLSLRKNWRQKRGFFVQEEHIGQANGQRTSCRTTRRRKCARTKQYARKLSGGRRSASRATKTWCGRAVRRTR